MVLYSKTLGDAAEYSVGEGVWTSPEWETDGSPTTLYHKVTFQSSVETAGVNKKHL